ncbi:Tail specific protease domain-containing protein [Vibrio crassostreae]|uniref:S41 family peptidase n=1 Tax=Vibrio sp. 10N.222.49.A3 TaxID=3229611 RepID=UPI002A6FFE3E|nr:Tail specific protease domain-containing protein [Vibrio crassostreae]CAK3625311.1 Tail specific protease domain-containing protein [Vibrio crassostreae]
MLGKPIPKSLLANYWRDVITHFPNFRDDSHRDSFNLKFYNYLDLSSLTFGDLLQLNSTLDDSHTDIFYKEKNVHFEFALYGENIIILENNIFKCSKYDIVKEVNGLSIKDIVNSYAKYVSSSNKRTIRYDAVLAYLKYEEIKTISKSGKLRIDTFNFSNYKDLAYLNLKSFNLDFHVIKNYLNTLKGKSMLLIDMRFNSGGNTIDTHWLLELFSSKPLHGTNWKSNQIISTFEAWNKFSFFNDSFTLFNSFYGRNSSFYPQSDSRLDINIYILMNRYTSSAAEDFILYMRGLSNVTLVGENSMGSSGQPITIEATESISYRICAKHDFITAPDDFLRKGVTPDIKLNNADSIDDNIVMKELLDLVY